MKYKLIRDVTVEECGWLDRTLKRGETVHSFDGETYGCITNTGTACSMDGNNPFFELPTDALSEQVILDNLRMWDEKYHLAIAGMAPAIPLR